MRYLETQTYHSFWQEDKTSMRAKWTTWFQGLKQSSRKMSMLRKIGSHKRWAYLSRPKRHHRALSEMPGIQLLFRPTMSRIRYFRSLLEEMNPPFRYHTTIIRFQLILKIPSKIHFSQGKIELTVDMEEASPLRQDLAILKDLQHQPWWGRRRSTEWRNQVHIK